MGAVAFDFEIHNRYYDSLAKRFLTADSYFLDRPEKLTKSPLEGNLFSYAKVNPITMLMKMVIKRIK